MQPGNRLARKEKKATTVKELALALAPNPNLYLTAPVSICI